ncbi:MULTISPECIES: transporter substrate-binding domain-containing protein [unclassified Kitasatospora]|uniref:transporter substrate-binding domain-containing protein n=1 Tax=unclassified Kitasatospora TaxID=2633591 RepID=UPI00382692D2
MRSLAIEAVVREGLIAGEGVTAIDKEKQLRINRSSSRRATGGKPRWMRGVAPAALVCCVSLAACTAAGGTSGAGSPTNAGGPLPSASPVSAAVALLPAAVRAKGTLTVAMVTNAPPGSSYAPGTEDLIGLDPDIARLLAQSLGLTLDVQVVAFDQITPGIAAGRYDVSVAEMAPTPEREKILDFVTYAQTGDALGVQKGNPRKLSVDSMCGHTIGALVGSYQVTEVLPDLDRKCTESGRQPIDLKLYPDQNSPVLALASGRIDGLYEDSTVVGYAAKQNPSIEVQADTGFSPIAIGIGKNSGLTDAVQAAMSQALTGPVYKAVLAKWGLESVAVTSAKVNDNGA